MSTFAYRFKATQQTKSAKPMTPGRARSEQSLAVSPILHVQRIIGNQAVQRLLQAKTEDHEANISTGIGHDFSRITAHASGHSNIQSKLRVGAPGVKYEQKGDRVAEQVIQMPEPQFGGQVYV